MAPGNVAVIVGASKGIGLELARIYLSQTNLQLVALSRNADQARKNILDTSSSSPLKVLFDKQKKGGNGDAAKPHAQQMDAAELSHLDSSRLTTIDIDIKKEDSIRSASEEVRKKFGDDSLRFLFNVAGVLTVEKNVGQVEYEEMLEQFQINTFAPLLTSKHFVPLFAKKLKANGDDDLSQGLLPHNLGVVANMSARVGSIAENQKGGWYSYRSSKAAQNQITRSLAHEFLMKKTPALCVGLHPGTVRTSLSEAFTGGPGGKKKPQSSQQETDEQRWARGEFEADEAAANLSQVIAQLKQEQSGLIWDYKGAQVPY